MRTQRKFNVRTLRCLPLSPNRNGMHGWRWRWRGSQLCAEFSGNRARVQCFGETTAWWNARVWIVRLFLLLIFSSCSCCRWRQNCPRSLGEHSQVWCGKLFVPISLFLLSELSQLTLVGVVEPIEAARNSIAVDFQTKTFETFEAALATLDAEIDGILICTPTDTHPGLIKGIPSSCQRFLFFSWQLVLWRTRQYFARNPSLLMLLSWMNFIFLQRRRIFPCFAVCSISFSFVNWRSRFSAPPRQLFREIEESSRERRHWETSQGQSSYWRIRLTF